MILNIIRIKLLLILVVLLFSCSEDLIDSEPNLPDDMDISTSSNDVIELPNDIDIGPFYFYLVTYPQYSI